MSFYELFFSNLVEVGHLNRLEGRGYRYRYRLSLYKVDGLILSSAPIC